MNHVFLRCISWYFKKNKTGEPEPIEAGTGITETSRGAPEGVHKPPVITHNTHQHSIW